MGPGEKKITLTVVIMTLFFYSVPQPDLLAQESVTGVDSGYNQQVVAYTEEQSSPDPTLVVASSSLAFLIGDGVLLPGDEQENEGLPPLEPEPEYQPPSNEGSFFDDPPETGVEDPASEGPAGEAVWENIMEPEPEGIPEFMEIEDTLHDFIDQYEDLLGAIEHDVITPEEGFEELMGIGEEAMDWFHEPNEETGMSPAELIEANLVDDFFEEELEHIQELMDYLDYIHWEVHDAILGEEYDPPFEEPTYAYEAFPEEGEHDPAITEEPAYTV